jgi:hypothetical protein
MTIQYTDNSISQQNVTVLDWRDGGTGDLNTASHYAHDRIVENSPASIYTLSVPLNTAKVTDALTFSSNQSEGLFQVGGDMHIFALTLSW